MNLGPRKWQQESYCGDSLEFTVAAGGHIVCAEAKSPNRGNEKRILITIDKDRAKELAVWILSL